MTRPLGTELTTYQSEPRQTLHHWTIARNNNSAKNEEIPSMNRLSQNTKNTLISPTHGCSENLKVLHVSRVWSGSTQLFLSLVFGHCSVGWVATKKIPSRPTPRPGQDRAKMPQNPRQDPWEVVWRSRPISRITTVWRSAGCLSMKRTHEAPEPSKFKTPHATLHTQRATSCLWPFPTNRAKPQLFRNNAALTGSQTWCKRCHHTSGAPDSLIKLLSEPSDILKRLNSHRGKWNRFVYPSLGRSSCLLWTNVKTQSWPQFWTTFTLQVK